MTLTVCPVCDSEEVQKDCIVVGRQRYKCNHLGHVFFTDDDTPPIPIVKQIVTVIKKDKPMVLKIEDLYPETVAKLGLEKEAAGAKLPPVPQKPDSKNPHILRNYYEANEQLILADRGTMGDAATKKRWGISDSGWARMVKRWQTGNLAAAHVRKDTLKRFEPNKEAIIADYYAMNLMEMKVKWHIPSNTWQKLKKLWAVKPKGQAKSKPKISTPPVTGLVMTRRAFLKLPVEERRILLSEQGETLREVCPSMFIPAPDKMDVIEGQLAAINEKLKSLDDNMANMLPPAMPDDIKEEIFWGIIRAYADDSKTAAKKVLQVMNALVGL